MNKEINLNKIILGIETSCDDTSIAIIQGETGLSKVRPTILAQELFSQETIFGQWGGIVPEIAARNHLEKIAPLLKSVLDKANLNYSDIDLIGVTTNPGLLGPLLTGLNAAKTFALVHEKPILPVNHLYAHLEAIHLTEQVSYPYLGLLVSGGHSLYLLVKDREDIQIIGSTIDDAAGEAFDKGGKILGLGYPAGRIIDELAKTGNEKAYSFPIALRDSKDSRLSFSGVKTSVRDFLNKNPQFDCNGLNPEQYPIEINDICASYQAAIVGALKLKLKYAYKKALELLGEDFKNPLPLVLGGGVACNSKLRSVIKDSYQNNGPVHLVSPSFCTDNGAMIANYTLRNFDKKISFPESLELDAGGRFIKKTALYKKGKHL